MTVGADVMFLNNIPFVVIFLTRVDFKMVTYNSQRLQTVLVHSIVKIYQFYKSKRYTIKTFLVNRQFEFIRDSLPEEENLNSTAENEHVQEIKHKNCVIKELAQALIITFPFKNIPGRIIIELIPFVGICINQEPSENGVSDVYYPCNIITGLDLAYENLCKFRFGSYVKAHKYRNITKYSEEQTVSVICLVATANFQRIYKIFSLKTVRVDTRKQKICEIPMPTQVIRCDEDLAARDKLDLANGNKPLSVDRFVNKTYFLLPSMRVESQEWHRMMIRTMVVTMAALRKYENLRVPIWMTHMNLLGYPLILQHYVEKLQECPRQNTQWNSQKCPHKKTQWNYQQWPHQKTSK